MTDVQREIPEDPARQIRRRSLLVLPAAAVVGITLATATPANAQAGQAECLADLMAGV